MKVITAEQYRLLSGLGEEPKEEDLIRILFGKPKSKMTIKEIKELDFTGFKMPEPEISPNLLLHNGVLYGRQNMSELTFGLYIDLVERAKDIQENLILIMTMLWRPVTKITYWNRTKAYVASKMLQSKWGKLRTKGLKLLNKVQYTIEDYDVMTCYNREDDFKTMDGSVAAYTTTFFLTTSQVLTIDSLRSLKKDLEEKAQVLQESLKKISADGDGSPTSGSLPGKEQSK